MYQQVQSYNWIKMIWCWIFIHIVDFRKSSKNCFACKIYNMRETAIQESGLSHIYNKKIDVLDVISITLKRYSTSIEFTLK